MFSAPLIDVLGTRKGYLWAIREIQDGRQDDRRKIVKNAFSVNLCIIPSNSIFPTKVGTRNSFLNLFLQSKVNFKVKGQVQGHYLRKLSATEVVSYTDG
jgi:hypothetical protein